MKNFLSNTAALIFIAILVAIPFVVKEREENKQRFAALHNSEELCMQALREAVLPAAQNVPHFLELDVWPKGASRSGDVVHAAARVVTLENSRSLSSAPDYTINCLVKGGVVASSAVTPTP